MTEVTTGNMITVLDLIKKGKPVIIHTFAVWCPACTNQLKETTKLVRNNPDNYTVLAIDIDPNENSATVLNHVRKNSFAGNFVSAPASVSRDLVKSLGTGNSLTLPQTIVVVNNTATHLGDGVFNEGRLKDIISRMN